jgi:hypothetical protein
MPRAAKAASKACSSPVSSPVTAFRSGRQRQETQVVARQPRQQSRAQERRFSGAGRAQNDEQPRRCRIAQAAQRIERFDDRALAPEEDAGVFGLERFEAAVRRALRLFLRGPGEKPWLDAAFRQATPQAAQSFSGEGDVLLGVSARQHHAKHAVVASRGEIDDLPGAGQVRRQLVDRDVFDQRSEQTLVEPPRQIEFVVAPARVEPSLRHQEQNRLAARRRLIERPLPALARRDADLRIGIDVEKDVGPTLFAQPIADRDRLRVIRTRVTEE